MVPIGMLIGVRDHVYDQDILEKGLPKWVPFYKLQQLDSNRDGPEILFLQGSIMKNSPGQFD